MGAVIRGISVLALENEVIAEVVSAAGASLAKKLVEKAIYLALEKYIEEDDGEPEAKRVVLKGLADFHEFLIED